MFNEFLDAGSNNNESQDKEYEAVKGSDLQSCVSACGLPSDLDFSDQTFPIQRSEEEWRSLLSEISFQVARKHKTEPPFQNPYFDHKELGYYACVGCDAPLFSSLDKYDSGTGWPSFSQAIDDRLVAQQVDNSLVCAALKFIVPYVEAIKAISSLMDLSQISLDFVSILLP